MIGLIFSLIRIGMYLDIEWYEASAKYLVLKGKVPLPERPSQFFQES